MGTISLRKKGKKVISRYYGVDNKKQKKVLSVFNISYLTKGAIAFLFLQGEG